MANPFITQADPLQQAMVDPEAQALQRQKQFAAMLMQSQQPQSQMVSGHYVAPSWTQQLDAALSPVLGAYMMKQADTEQEKLAEKIRQQGEKDIQAYGQAVTGKPAVQGGIYGPDGKLTTQTTADMYGADMQLNPQYKEVQAQEAVAPDFAKGLSILRSSKDPETRALGKMLMADMFKTQKVGPEETLVRGNFQGGFTPVITGAPKETPELKTAAALVGLGNKPINTWTPQEIAIVDKKVQQLKQPLANISVSTGKDLASQVGDMAKESKIKAMGAVQSATAANNIINAIDTNKMFAGPGATVKMKTAQIGQMIGAGGNNDAEKIANTRQTIQGLAQLTLQGRKQMRGEGQITENEGKLAERAMSGDIDMTASEIRQLANAAKRVSKFDYDMHQQIISTMGSDPNTKSLVPYYQVPANEGLFNIRPAGKQSDVRSQADAILNQGK